MQKQSAGVLFYRRAPTGLQVLLVHPGGPFWARKDAGAWSIPKGECNGTEDPLQAALREVTEELGSCPAGTPIALAPVRQPAGKLVLAWAIEADFDPGSLRSNTFSMEWPPKSGRQQSFPEVDRAEWFDVDEARRKLLTGQVALLEQFVTLTRSPPHP